MIKMKGGFTLIEVSLFLAITGLLFLGVTIGVQNSIFQQRYNDSVQNFVEFLRSAYSKTENVQNAGRGNTSEAIYGKLITFGEKNNLAKDSNDGEIFMYDVIGEAKCKGSFDGTLDALVACGAEVSNEEGPIGLAESYKPRWSAAIQNERGDLFRGAVLITRHPQSGTVHTFVMNGDTVDVNSGVKLSGFLADKKFESAPIDFCVNPNGDMKNSAIRADVRIKMGARNSSGVEIMPDRSDANEETGEFNICADRG